MSELLNDKVNLDLLENICSGTGLSINISALSHSLKKHRNTIGDKVRGLVEHKIINKPIYPFIHLYQECPLLVIVRADFPRNEGIEKFLIEDEHIFAAFRSKDGEYNTLLIEYHKDLYSYNLWRKAIVKEKRIPPRETRYPADALFFSNKLITKYKPHCPIYIMEEAFKKKQRMEINKYELDELSFHILKKLLTGEGIRTNENLLSEKMGVHRKTIERRISSLLKEKIVLNPVCRFPKFLVPPNYILVYCLIEVKKSMDKILKAIEIDHHIPLALESGTGRYNLLLFGTFFTVEEHFEWEEEYDRRFPGCFGAMKKIYLSPDMTYSIDQQKVSLNIIKCKKEEVYGKALMDFVMMQSPQ